MQEACVHIGGAVGVGACEGELTGTEFGQPIAGDGACPSDGAASGGVHTAVARQSEATRSARCTGEGGIEIQAGVVHHQLRGLCGGGGSAQVGIAADGQAARVDLCGAGVGIVATERECAAALLLEHTAT